MSFLQKIMPWRKVEKKSHVITLDDLIRRFDGVFDQEVSASDAYSFYESVAPLATVVDKIVNAAKSIWPILSDGEQIVSNHPLLDFLENPGFGQTYEEFFADYATSYLLTNNAYMNLIGNPDKPPAAMQVIMPFNVNVTEGEDGYAETYHVNLNGKSQVDFERNIKNGRWRFLNNNMRELIHQKGVSDRHGLLGASVLSPIKIELEQRLAGARLNLAFMNNGARPSGIVNAETQVDDDQYQIIIDQLRHNNQGVENAGNVMFFAGAVMKFLELSKNPKDMDYAMLLKESEEVTARRYNVPLPLIRGEQMTLNNLQTAELTFWNNAVLQLVSSIFSTWTRALKDRYQLGNLFITFDRTSIQSLQIVNHERAKLMQQTNSFSDNEIRESVGYEPYSGGDTIYKPAQLLPVGQDEVRDELSGTPE